MKRLFFCLLAVLILTSCFLSACGNKNTGSTPDQSAISETTVVLETTSEGGTVEQDPEGNKITKDKEGKVTHVEDKTGKTIEVTDYLATHAWVEADGSSVDGSVSSSGSSSGGSSDSKKRMKINHLHPKKRMLRKKYLLLLQLCLMKKT
nr:hypothetical protein [uncultured Ruminococcus sp.]